jgi:hypothetical protein
VVWVVEWVSWVVWVIELVQNKWEIYMGRFEFEFEERINIMLIKSFYVFSKYPNFMNLKCIIKQNRMKFK